MMKKINLLKTTMLFFAASCWFATNVYSKDIDASKHYRLTTKWLGEDKSLDVINDGKNNQLHLFKSGNLTGQHWKLIPVGDGYFRLTTQWLGKDKSLDVINDGKNNQLHMANTGNLTGQFWKLTPVGDGYYRLTTKWLGEGKSLDVINDGKNNQLHLANTGNFTGQFWKLTMIEKPEASVDLPSKFKVLAFSVGEGKSDKDAYWFALNNNDSRGRILSQAKLGSNAKWMEIQSVDLGNDTYAFKVTNAGADMYLTARDNKEVHAEKAAGGSVPEGAKFKSVSALTSAPGANERNFRSFQSVKFANHYLRHSGFAMFVHTSNGTELFKQDASWLIEKM